MDFHLTTVDLRDNCIQNLHLGRYIVGYTIRNIVLGQLPSRAVKCDFRIYIRRYTFPNENFEYGCLHSSAVSSRIGALECEVINDVKLFPTVYCRIYCHNFLTLSNHQTSRYISKCMRMNLSCTNIFGPCHEKT